MNPSVTVYFGAHIDDVFLGAFSHLAQNESGKKILVCTSDNMPSPIDYPNAYRDIKPSDYRIQLNREVRRVCAAANIDQYIELAIPDGKSLLNIESMAREIENILSAHRPTCVVFPTYEGGHIDHEILSLIVGRHHTIEEMLEYALYHKTDAHTYVHNTFPNGQHQLKLSPQILQKKKDALSLLHTKQADISYFNQPELESIRAYQLPDLANKPAEYLLYEHSQNTTYDELIQALQNAKII